MVISAVKQHFCAKNLFNKLIFLFLVGIKITCNATKVLPSNFHLLKPYLLPKTSLDHHSPPPLHMSSSAVSSIMAAGLKKRKNKKCMVCCVRRANQVITSTRSERLRHSCIRGHLTGPTALFAGDGMRRLPRATAFLACSSCFFYAVPRQHSLTGGATVDHVVLDVRSRP